MTNSPKNLSTYSPHAYSKIEQAAIYKVIAERLDFLRDRCTAWRRYEVGVFAVGDGVKHTNRESACGATRDLRGSENCRLVG